MWIELCTGLLAGGVHTLSGPDHLAAVAPLALRRPREASRAGLRWGLGHALGVGLLAGAGWWLRSSIEIEPWSQLAERLVGVALVGIGLWAVRGALRSRLHAHEHEHEHEHEHPRGADTHRHAHVHLHLGSDAHEPSDARDPGHTSHSHVPSGSLDRSHSDDPSDSGSPYPSARAARSQPAHSHRHVALGMGALHGIAGTAHLVAVLPALALPTPQAAAAYLVGYGGGAALSMGAFGWLVGRVGRSEGFDGTRAYRTLLSSTGLAAVAVGGFWLVS